MKISKVYDANVYVNSSSKHGQASEVTCPEISAVMTDYKSLGMVGSAEFFNGIDKMEAT
ncbi:MAG: phage major tail tube protein, partial [Dysgonamonadaceae bacterium]|nr:phage major tail tube protein [Dysgonamonadaceae bacterium]